VGCQQPKRPRSRCGKKKKKAGFSSAWAEKEKEERVKMKFVFIFQSFENWPNSNEKTPNDLALHSTKNKICTSMIAT
jgi:hypothetical protein